MTDSDQVRAEEIKKQFATRRKRQWMVLPLYSPLLVMAFAIKSDPPFGISSGALSAAAVIGILGAGAFSSWNLRCPACNGFVGGIVTPRSCSKCKAALK